MKFLKISAFVGASMLAAPAAMADTILIDDFSATGFIASNANGNPASAEFSGGGILGGERFMWVSSDDSPSPGLGSTFEATGSALNFSNSAANPLAAPPVLGTGQAVLVYDGLGGVGSPETFEFVSVPAALTPSPDFPTGTTAEIAVDTDGLADGLGNGIDFLDGFDILQRGIEFEFASFDPGGILQFYAYAWDTDGNLATFDETLENNSGLPTDVDFDTFLGLSEFTSVGTDIDWTSIGAIAFSVESLTPEFDGILTSISVVPLPLSALLLLGGLGGLAGASTVSKRRRQKA